MYIQKIINKFLEDIETLKVDFIMIYIIHKNLVLLKLSRIVKRFLKSVIDFYFVKKINNFFTTYDHESSTASRI